MTSTNRNVDTTEIDGSCNGVSNQFSLPDDLVFKILLCLPADVLYNVMRCVCHQWYNIIKSPLFISSHLQKNLTTNGLLVTSNGYVLKPWLQCGHKGGFVVEVTDLNFEFVHKVCGSCNGLLYVAGPIERTSSCPSYIVNPITKQYLPVPVFHGFLERNRCCFGYGAGSRVYKVMHHTIDESRCLILSLGVDKTWRKIDLSKLSVTAKQVMKNSDTFLTVSGFVYCLYTSKPIILRFDIETETFEEIHVSLTLDKDWGLVPMDNSVCLWKANFNGDKCYEFWVMKDCGECEKMFTVDVGLNMTPICWLRSMDLLIFYSKAQIMFYNVSTDQVQVEMNKKATYYFNRLNYHVHEDSLVPLNNLSLVMTP